MFWEVQNKWELRRFWDTTTSEFVLLIPCIWKGGLLLYSHAKELCSGYHGRQSRMGSLAGAAHLLKANAGVQWAAQWEQKSHVDQKGKCCFNLVFQYETGTWKRGLSILSVDGYSARGVRKVTTGITGLWQPSVHSDVAFWSFDVGSSYHWDAAVS